MTYQETRSNEDLAGAPVERCELVASSSRPPSNFVPAVNRSPELPSTFWQPPNSDLAVWQPTEAIDERTSAVDRAWGYNIRLIAPLALAIVLALTGTVAFVVVMRWTATPVDALKALLVFLLCLGVGFGIAAIYISNADYRNSASGVELVRITEAAKTQREANEQSFKLRRAALDAYIGRLQDHE
jgi:hypothetical protein